MGKVFAWLDRRRDESRSDYDNRINSLAAFHAGYAFFSWENYHEDLDAFSMYAVWNSEFNAKLATPLPPGGYMLHCGPEKAAEFMSFGDGYPLFVKLFARGGRLYAESMVLADHEEIYDFYYNGCEVIPPQALYYRHYHTPEDAHYDERIPGGDASRDASAPDRGGAGSQDERGKSSGARSAGGSYRSGAGSYRIAGGSYRSEAGSYRSAGGSYRSAGGSYRSGAGSYRSAAGSYHSARGSYLQIGGLRGSYRGGSYGGGLGSYRFALAGYYGGSYRLLGFLGGSYRIGSYLHGSYRYGSYRQGMYLYGSYRHALGSYASMQGLLRSGSYYRGFLAGSYYGGSFRLFYTLGSYARGGSYPGQFFNGSYYGGSYYRGSYVYAGCASALFLQVVSDIPQLPDAGAQSWDGDQGVALAFPSYPVRRLIEEMGYGLDLI